VETFVADAIFNEIKKCHMKIIDYLYFNIYRWYYQMRVDGRKVNPPSLTASLFGICLSGWFFFFDYLYYHFKLHKFPENIHKLLTIFIAFLVGGIINKIYFSNDRYLQVYNGYMSSGIARDKKKGLFFHLFLYFPLLYVWLFFWW
jgi:hypothetical protein